MQSLVNVIQLPARGYPEGMIGELIWANEYLCAMTQLRNGYQITILRRGTASGLISLMARQHTEQGVTAKLFCKTRGERES